MQLNTSILHPIACSAIVGIAVLTGCQGAAGPDLDDRAMVDRADLQAADTDRPLLGPLTAYQDFEGVSPLIGAKEERLGDVEINRSQARQAVEKAQRTPAIAADARAAVSADINLDGFITIDEITAMEKAGLSDSDMIQRINAVDSVVFELSPSQEARLLDAGVNRTVVQRLRELSFPQRIDEAQPTTTEPLAIPVPMAQPEGAVDERDDDGRVPR